MDVDLTPVVQFFGGPAEALLIGALVFFVAAVVVAGLVEIWRMW
jgi:hypothetical protein